MQGKTLIHLLIEQCKKSDLGYLIDPPRWSADAGKHLPLLRRSSDWSFEGLIPPGKPWTQKPTKFEAGDRAFLPFQNPKHFALRVISGPYTVSFPMTRKPYFYYEVFPWDSAREPGYATRYYVWNYMLFAMTTDLIAKKRKEVYGDAANS